MTTTVTPPSTQEASPAWTELPGVWTNLQIATALFAAIFDGSEDKPLKYSVFDAERVCRQIRDEMAAQLAAAQERIRELEAPATGWEPDWAQSPKWAQFWAMDDNGESYWFADEPHCNMVLGAWQSDNLCAMHKKHFGKWINTLRRRPAAEAEEK